MKIACSLLKATLASVLWAANFDRRDVLDPHEGPPSLDLTIMRLETDRGFRRSVLVVTFRDDENKPLAWAPRRPGSCWRRMAAEDIGPGDTPRPAILNGIEPQPHRQNVLSAENVGRRDAIDGGRAPG